jgi:hypothetical protein
LNAAAGGTESGRLRGRDPILERIPATRNLAYRARYLVNAYPALYMPIGRFRHRHSSDYCVGPGTEIVIEGFGRAGSTFAWLAFMSAQDRPVRTAHHTHAAAQVITAVRLGKPTLVIVRPPTDAALAHMARKGITARMALVAWTRFHRRILPYAEGFVVCSFGEMTTNFGPVVERVNQRFGTDFGVFEHSPEHEQEIFDQIRERNRRRFGDQPSGDSSKALGLPSAEREALKETFRSQLAAPDLEQLRNRAQRTYDALVTPSQGSGLG